MTDYDIDALTTQIERNITGLIEWADRILVQIRQRLAEMKANG